MFQAISRSALAAGMFFLLTSLLTAPLALRAIEDHHQRQLAWLTNYHSTLQEAIDAVKSDSENMKWLRENVEIELNAQESPAAFDAGDRNSK